MESEVIYRKTDKGRAEIAQRSGALSAMQRRILVLIDGRKASSDLSAFVRVGELDGGLQLLLDTGLIEPEGRESFFQEPIAPGFAPSREGQTPRAATSLKEFITVRQQTSQFVTDRLGPAGEPICEAIERCNSPVELRKLLRGVEIFVGERLDAATSQAFARHFGALLL